MRQIKDPQAATEATLRLDDLDAHAGAGTALRPAARSCCCSAPPAFRVIVTSKVPLPHSVDLLMCGHHYRRCAPALARLAALVLDQDGRLVSPAVSS
jgi:hypothetical protein